MKITKKTPIRSFLEIADFFYIDKSPVEYMVTGISKDFKNNLITIEYVSTYPDCINDMNKRKEIKYPLEVWIDLDNYEKENPEFTSPTNRDLPEIK